MLPNTFSCISTDSYTSHLPLEVNCGTFFKPRKNVIHLNQSLSFILGVGGNGLLKINSLVDYPISNLDLSFMMDLPDKNRKCANCNHIGCVEWHHESFCRLTTSPSGVLSRAVISSVADHFEL